MIKLQGFNIAAVPNKINRGVSVIIYANPGIGKTTLASTLPQDETLIVNSEAGLGPLLGKGHALLDLRSAVSNKKTLAAVLDQLLIQLRTESHGIKYLVLDNVSEMYDQFILETTSGRDKSAPELREYGDAGFKLKEWMHNFRDLDSRGINVIFNAWEQVLDIKAADGSITTMTVPMLGKKTALQSCGIVDIVGHLEANEKSGARRIRLGANDQYLVKCQFAGVDTFEPPDMLALINKVKAFNYGDKDERK